MSLASGTSLGPYEIRALIGAGGMGEVYRALDPRLGREVAIKVSAAQFTERFDREARAVAALNHNNICHLYDVGPNYIVMELVEGESPRGPLPLETVLSYARQIAEALEAAHEKGIVHRDLKPGNIKIKADGTVKVLDFGLAKVAPVSSTADGSVINSPTMSMAATNAGIILGTAAYMSPEQARGEPVDQRADIWSFGVVLYELLTGSRTFDGRTISDTLAAVLIKEPDLGRVPSQVRPLLRGCLAKDPKQRLHHAADVRLLLEGMSQSLPDEATARPTSRFGRIAVAAAAVLAIALGALAFVHFREKPAEAPVVRFEVPHDAVFGLSGSTVALSPDGKHLAFAANGPGGTNQLWIRSLDALEAKALPGTDGVLPAFFWSPDSRSIGFGTFLNKLRRVDISGGPPQTVCDLPSQWRGGSWGRGISGKGTIIFGVQGGGLMQVPEEGGTPRALTTKNLPPRGESEHTQPFFLPDHRHFLYYRAGGAASPQVLGIYLGSLDIEPDQQSIKRLVASSSGPGYVPVSNSSTGYLLFIREGSLMVQAFDENRMDVSGDAIPIAEGFGGSNVAPFSASETGVLAYQRGDGISRRLTWFDRTGKALKTEGSTGDYSTMALSPDGTRVAFSRVDNGNTDIWIHEFAQGSAKRFTFDAAPDVYAIWSPDGNSIVFSSTREAQTNLYRTSSNGAGSEETFLKSNEPIFPQDWSRDGVILFSSQNAATGFDLWSVGVDRQSQPRKYLGTEFNESQGKFSPDGRFVAYTSNESSKSEVYVRPFPNATEDKWMISLNGGSAPRWGRDGKELFYISSDSKLMSVEVSTMPTFKKGVPRALFTAPIYGGGTTVNQTRYDVSQDGQRFLINSDRSESNAAVVPITVILNWRGLLKR